MDQLISLVFIIHRRKTVLLLTSHFAVFFAAHCFCSILLYFLIDACDFDFDDFDYCLVVVSTNARMDVLAGLFYE